MRSHHLVSSRRRSPSAAPDAVTAGGAMKRLAVCVVVISLFLVRIVSPAWAQAPGQPPGQAPGSSASVTYYATHKLDGGAATQSDQTYSADATDTSAVWVTNSGALTLDNCTITTTGDTSSQDNSSFYGLNAGILAATGTIRMLGGSITTSGTGANGAFATGSGSSITLSDVTISAAANGGHGVMATQGGSLILTNVNMTTAGANSGVIATDRGGGTITVTGGTVLATGQDSPGIYSTGNIMVSGATITATGAEAAVIEGANSITLTDTALASSKEGKWGVMIYQSMSGDAEGTKGTFTMTGGSLANTATSGPLFFVTNSTGVITLTGVTVTAASGKLVEAGATTRWGSTGSNGGTVVFTADAETLVGDMVTDDAISSITATLKNGTTLKGTINSAALSLDATSAWTVTGTSYLTGLDDAGGISGTSITNIIGNGNNVYYDASLSANSALGGKTYSLAGGGQLTPTTGTDSGDASAASAAGLCGAGILSALPLTALGTGAMRRGIRRRAACRSATPRG